METLKYLQRDYQVIDGLFQKILENRPKDDEEARRKFGQLRDQILTHLRSVQMAVYGEIGMKAVGSDTVAELDSIHGELEAQLFALEEVPVRGPHWRQGIQAFRESFGVYRKEMERHVLPHLEDRLSPKVSRRLVDMLQRQKRRAV